MTKSENDIDGDILSSNNQANKETEERKRKASPLLQSQSIKAKIINQPAQRLRLFLCHPSNYLNSKTLSTKCRFVPGDAVYYRSCNSGKETSSSFACIFQRQECDHQCIIQRVDDTSEDQAHTDEVTVETRRLVPLYQNQRYQEGETQLIVTPTTARFRQLAKSLPKQQHHVLEVGCSTGQTSQILIPAAKSWVGLDTSADMIQTVQGQIPNSDHTFSVRVDALVDPQMAKEVASSFADKGPSIVFLDIGGNREGLAVLNMIDFCLFHLDHIHQIFVKSEALFESLLQQQDQHSEGVSASNKTFATVNDMSEWLKQQKSFFSNVAFHHRTSDPSENNNNNSPFVFPKHPLKAPLRLSPIDKKTPICRFHNYHRNGCAKQSRRRFIDDEKTCPYDHEHCHFCLARGHVALGCPSRPRKEQE